MFTGIFAAIQLILRLFGLWDMFLNYSDKKRLADSQERTEDRNTAVDDQKKATDEEQFDKDQSSITHNHP